MVERLVEIMLGLTVVIAQASIFGLLAHWLASRSSRAARVIGGIVVVLLGWMSFVPLLDRTSGYEPRSAVDSNLTIVIGLVVGWVAGRNRRLRGTAARLLLDEKVRFVGAGIVALSYVFGVVISILALIIELRIVNEAAGFWGFMVAFFMAPATLVAAPLYAGIALHDWMPAIFAYGGLLTMYLGFLFGGIVSQGVPD